MSNAATRIVIHRTSQYANKVRSIGIYINGQKAGTIDDGEVKEFAVSPGSSEIRAKIDWCRTRPLTLDIREGQSIDLELGSPLKGMNVLLAIVYVFRINDWIYLKPL
jgi:hypothetical protein